jgi:putative nucleotidyltransferase with HDIG domain
MELMVMLLLGLLMLALLAIAVVSARQDEGSPPSAPVRRAAPAPAARRPAPRSSGETATGPERSPEGQRGAGATASPVHVWRFEPAPEDFRYQDDGDDDDGDMSEIMAQADSIAGRLKARQNILAGVTGAEFNPKQITELVLSDAALAAQVLRIVNSAFYGLSQKVGSVFRAVVYLGHVEVRNIIWRACVNEGLGGADKAAQALVEGLWQHSFATSKVAFALAKSRGLAEPDKISTMALLHDIGKLICLNVWPERAKALYYPVHFTDRSVLVEEARLGARHARLGAAVAAAWGLPDESLQVIRHHHAPSYVSISAIDPGSRRSLAVVHLADLFVHAATPAPEDEDLATVYQPHDSWLRLLGAESVEQLCTGEVEAALPRLRLMHLPQMAPEHLSETAQGEPAEAVESPVD